MSVRPRAPLGLLAKSLDPATGLATDASMLPASALAGAVNGRMFPGLSWGIDPSAIADGSLGSIADASNRNVVGSLGTGSHTVDRLGFTSKQGAIRCAANHQIYTFIAAAIPADNWSLHFAVNPTAIPGAATYAQFMQFGTGAGTGTLVGMMNGQFTVASYSAPTAGALFGTVTAAPTLVSIFRRSGVISARVNGASVVVANAALALGASGSGFTCIGSFDGGGTLGFAGAIGEVWAFAAGLTDAQAALLEGGIGRRYGIW